MARVIRLIAAAAVAAAATSTAETTVAAPFYEGKTITIIVGFRPGSGIDLNAREFANFMPKHIPGHPKMIVKNRAGGGTAAQNYMYEHVRADGLSVVYGPWNPVGQITRSRTLRVRYEKVSMIGGGGTIRLSWANKEAVPAPDQIVKAGEKRMLNYAGNRVTGSIDLLSRLALDLMKVNYRVTFGYDQTATMRALPQNEVQVATASLNNWVAYLVPTVIKQGKGIPLWYYPRLEDDGSVVRSDYTGDMPMFFDVYKKIHGSDMPPDSPTWKATKWLLNMGTLSQTMWAPPNTPKEAVDALREGFWKTVKSKEYIDLFFKKYGAPLEFADLKTVLRVVNNVEKAPDDVRQFFKDYIKQGRGFRNIKKGKKKKS